MQKILPELSYQQRLSKLANDEKKLLKRKSSLSLQRFAFVVISFIALWKLWNFSIPVAIAGFIIFFGLFIYTVAKDLRNKEAIENKKLLTSICQKELDILNHQFTDLPDGKELEPDHHDYSNDLDIFGKSSLYQYINRTTSQQGNQKIANWLLFPAEIKTIAQRQQASKVLSTQPEWMQQFRAYGINDPLTILSETKIKNWLDQEDRTFDQSSWKIVRIVFPIITLVTLFLLVIEKLPLSWFIYLLILFMVIASQVSKRLMPRYTQLNKIVPELETLENSIRHIEKSSFESDSINELKNKLNSGSGLASSSIRDLKKILARLDYRYNPIVYFPLNTFLLWDLQQIFQLDKWKIKNKEYIPSWFSVIAEMEALISIATATFNHPDWCYPEHSDDQGAFIGEDIGHPLIPKANRVCNSFSTEGEKQINLITGSNMAGKSTFLRSVGINLVLAMMGAPVCCRYLKVSSMKVISSMRVSDNLEENTSTFYAELKKLKEIIEAANKKEKIFVLLDEILRGTNSADRHTGSVALLKQLIKENASGMVATHDLELAKLADQYPDSVHNYHFDVQVKNEELFFDYKLKTGICTSMNASLLMKKIGIEL